MVGALWLSRYFYHTNQLLHLPGFSLLYFKVLPVKHADLGYQLACSFQRLHITDLGAGWVSRYSNKGKMKLEPVLGYEDWRIVPYSSEHLQLSWCLWQQPRMKSSLIQNVILSGFSVRSIFHSWHCFYATNVRVSAKYVWLLSFHPPFLF